MPELNFQVSGVEASVRTMTPMLHFRLRITTTPAEEAIQGILLNAQIQIQSPQRRYSLREKEKLVELFGPPEAWGQTLRNRLWTNTSAVVGAFRGSAEVVLPAPCTFDLNVASAKYFNGVEDGEVPLLFLLSGSIFYSTSEGRVQVAPISWNTECVYRMPLQAWRYVMEQHYPNSAWLSLRREVFDQLCDYKRRQGLIGWEETIEKLLRGEREEVAV